MTVRIDNSPTIKSRRHPLDQVCINTIRALAIDAIQAANSGHARYANGNGSGRLLPVAILASI